MKPILKKAISLVLSLAIYGILVFGIFSICKMVVDRTGLRQEFLTIVSGFGILLALLVSTGNVVKNMYMNGDNELLLRFPVSGKEIFASKAAYCMLHNLVITALILLPFYFSYGAATEAGVGFYFMSMLAVILASFAPYLIANIIAVPVMMMTNLVKNQFMLVLAFVIIVICASFIIYIEMLSNVLKYLGTESENIFSLEMIARYRAFGENFHPFVFFGNLMSGSNAGMSSGQVFLQFLYIMLINGGLMALSFFVSTKVYYKTILYGVETEKASFTKKIKDKQRTVVEALLRRELFLILRSFNYSFQYLAMAIAAPVMVFVCNRLALAAGTDNIGVDIIPGLTLMIIIIFVSITVSFASTTISREGNAFYLTKIMPVKYTTQVAAKFLLYTIVGTGSVILCCLVTGAAYATPQANYLIKPEEVVAIFFLSEMMVISLTSIAILSDIKRPTFNMVGDGEMVDASSNVALSLMIGILTAVVFGVVSMVLSFLPITINDKVIIDGVGDAFGYLSIISIIILGSTLTALFVGLEKRYNNIIV